MTDDEAAIEQPPGRRLAYMFDRRYSPMAIAGYAHGVCRLVWVVDTSDPEAASMARLLRRLGDVVDVAGLSIEQAADALAAAELDGILSQTDAFLLRTARIAERLGLPSMTPAVAERLSDKHLQRAAMAAGGLPGPAFWTVPLADDPDEWSALARDATFPAILKPRYGTASRDTVRVDSMEQLRGVIAELYAQAPERPAMVLEEFLQDKPGAGGEGFACYVSVESLVCEGRSSHVAISGRTPSAEPFRETGAFIPAQLPQEDREAVLDTATRAIAALGLDLGSVHTEIKLTPAGPRVIEINGRIGGFVPGFFTKAIGFELMPLAMRLALGEKLSFDALPRATGVTYDLRLQAPMGIRQITAVEGHERLIEDPFIDEVSLSRGPGADVDWREGNNEHVLGILGTAPDHDELRRILRLVETQVQIRGE